MSNLNKDVKKFANRVRSSLARNSAREYSVYITGHNSIKVFIYNYGGDHNDIYWLARLIEGCMYMMEGNMTYTIAASARVRYGWCSDGVDKWNQFAIKKMEDWKIIRADLKNKFPDLKFVDDEDVKDSLDSVKNALSLPWVA